MDAMSGRHATVTVERAERLDGRDLSDLCDAAEAAILAGGGFGWLRPPPRETLERFWRGVILVPERILFLGRLDGVIAASVQLQKQPRNNEAQGHAAQLTGHFVAPWARGHGLARTLVLSAEAEARGLGFRVVTLDVRETQDAAIRLYESLGFERWGSNPRYALVEGRYITGHYYAKEVA